MQKNISYVSKITESSKLPDFDGVKFTFMKLTEGRRLDLRAKIWDAVVRTTVLQEQLRPLQDKARSYEESLKTMDDAERASLNPDKDYIDTLVAIGPIVAELLRIDEETTRPAYFRCCFVSVSGMDINGIPPAKVTAEVMIEQGPPELVHEITQSIYAAAGLAPKEKENLESPTTLGAEAGGPTTDTIAQSASSPDTTLGGTAASTTQMKSTVSGTNGGFQNTQLSLVGSTQ